MLGLPGSIWAQGLRALAAGAALWQNAAILEIKVERQAVANDEHLALLRKGVAIWNEWRARNPDEKPDLSEASLSNASLSGADLSKADLSDAYLYKADLKAAILCEADLHRAHLGGANLAAAHLTNAYLGGAALTGAKLTGADLTGARLNMARLHDAVLRGARLTGADLLGTDFTGAVLNEADFSGAQLCFTIFAYSYLSKAIGLHKCEHKGPSVIDPSALLRSDNLPISFLRGCGLPEPFIEYLPSLTGSAIRFYSCFVSYSAKDQVFVERLHADLQNKGVRCWFAPHDLPIGAKTWDAIDEAIRLRDKLLVILSKASIGSDWVEDEVSKALAEERSRRQVVLFPIRIDNEAMSTAEPWAVKLRDQRNIGDFRQWKKPAEYQKSLERLLRDLTTSGTK
jgi:uncharacterized protein YjbI with pentapeptide repeats